MFRRSRGDADLQVLWISTPDQGWGAWRLANLGYCRSPCHATAPRDSDRSATHRSKTVTLGEMQMVTQSQQLSPNSCIVSTVVWCSPLMPFSPTAPGSAALKVSTTRHSTYPPTALRGSASRLPISALVWRQWLELWDYVWFWSMTWSEL